MCLFVFVCFCLFLVGFDVFVFDVFVFDVFGARIRDCVGFVFELWFSKQVIHNLNEVNDNDSTSYYYYNEVDFYYKKIKNDDNLVVAFHGATNNYVSLPIFRCYN
jgi:hypothetical protein